MRTHKCFLHMLWVKCHNTYLLWVMSVESRQVFVLYATRYISHFFKFYAEQTNLSLGSKLTVATHYYIPGVFTSGWYCVV